jgi:hypothetical protein
MTANDLKVGHAFYKAGKRFVTKAISEPYERNGLMVHDVETESKILILPVDDPLAIVSHDDPMGQFKHPC